MERNFRSSLKKICSEDMSAALITIIGTKGSTPRKAGAKMAVLRDGRSFGTIGGGCGEAEVYREALNVLDSNRSATYTVDMTNEMAEEDGMVCGGKMEVFIDVLRAGINSDKKLLSDYITALENNNEPVLATVIRCGDFCKTRPGNRFFITPTGLFGDPVAAVINPADKILLEESRIKRKPFLFTASPACSEIPETDDSQLIELFIEPPPQPLELLILGGGHISLPLSKMAKIAGFKVTVIDDRPSFANKNRFENADQVICDDFAQAIRRININRNTSVVIVTRGHRHDKICLREIVGHPALYIGMIGSKRRVKALISELVEDGIDRDLLSLIHAPIGLDIGAETPEEIAVSILAEVIGNYHGGSAKSLNQPVFEITGH